MRRATRFSFLFFGALVAAIGGYTGYWFITAGHIENGVAAWAHSQRADKVVVSWQKLRVSGFPVRFDVDLEGLTVRDEAHTPSPEFRIPTVSGTARPWDFTNWRLAASDGLSAEIAASGERAPAQLTVRSADGAVSIDRNGGWKVWLRAQDAGLESASRLFINSADAWLIAPPRQNTRPRLALAVSARQVTLSAGIEPLGNTIDELDFAATINGAVRNGRLPEVLAAWRDAGGTIELEGLRLKWDAIDATASGTMLLDEELQPAGVFSGGLAGYDEILTALVQRGQMRPGDANLARIALAMLAKAGPDGKPRIKTAFALRDGEFFLGPAKLGKAPRLTWE